MQKIYSKINFKYKEYILFIGFIIFFIYLHYQNNKILYETFQTEIDAKNVKIIINDSDYSKSGEYSTSTISRNPEFYLKHYDDVFVNKVDWHIKQDIMIERIDNKLSEINKLVEEIELEKNESGKIVNNLLDESETDLDLPEDPDDYPMKTDEEGNKVVDVDALQKKDNNDSI